MFYLSEYLENNRDEYYLRLKNISAENDWNNWIAFFLKAIAHQAKDNSKRVKEIMTLYGDMKVKIHEITHSQYSVYLLDAIFKKPIFKVSDTSKQLKNDYGIHGKTISALLRQLRDAGVLIEIQSGGGQRSATLCFPALINLAEGRKVFVESG